MRMGTSYRISEAQPTAPAEVSIATVERRDAVARVVASATGGPRWLWVALAVTLAALSLLALLTLLYGAHEALPPERFVTAQELPRASLREVIPERWVSLELPNKLCSRDCEHPFKAYRLRFSGTELVRPQVYLTLYDGAAAVYLNDSLIGETGSLEDPLADTTYQPAVFTLPSGLLRARANELTIIVASVLPSGGRLAPFYLGDARVLRFPATVARLATVHAPRVLFGMLGILALVSLLTYLSGDRAAIYLWFLALCVAAAVRLLDVVFPEISLNEGVQHSLYLSSTLAVVLTGSGFLTHLAGGRASVLALASLWFCGSLGFFALLSHDFKAGWFLANQIIALFALVFTVKALRDFWFADAQIGTVQFAGILGLIALGLGLVFHDIVLAQFGSGPLVFALSNLAALPIMMAFGFALAARHGAQLRAVGEAVRTTTAELMTAHEKLRVQEQAQILSEERQRLLEEMHDGIGGRLASLALEARSGRKSDRSMAEALDQSLLDLRLIIDALDPAEGESLSGALVRLRERLTPWLEGFDLEVRWSIAATLPTSLKPAVVLAVTRTIQEALNNVVRHARATRVWVAVAVRDGALLLEIRDDGVGFDVETAKGRGLNIMRQRANKLGAAFDLSSDRDGSRIVFQVRVAETP